MSPHTQSSCPISFTFRCVALLYSKMLLRIYTAYYSRLHLSVKRASANRASPNISPRAPGRHTPTDCRNRVIMAHMFTLSDNESDTSEDHEDSGRTKAKIGSPQRKQQLNVPDRLKREQLVRQRNHSMNEEDLKDTSTGEEEELVNDSFRRRSRSAPPALWAAKKYGQQLRRMSDEFDILLDNGMKRVKSAGTASHMHQSPSWLAFLWSHKESDAESRPAE